MFQGIEHWFQKLLGSMSKEEKVFLTYTLPIIQADTGKIIADGLPLAVEIVKGLMGLGTLTGPQKLQQASTDLKTKMVSEGIAGAEDIGTRTLNFIVQTALGNLDATQPPAVSGVDQPTIS